MTLLRLEKNRGVCKSTYTPIDVLSRCIICYDLNVDGRDHLKYLRIITSTFKMLFSIFLDLLFKQIYDEHIQNFESHLFGLNLPDQNLTFPKISYAWYDKDVTFQKCRKFRGTLHEGKLYFN